MLSEASATPSERESEQVKLATDAARSPPGQEKGSGGLISSSLDHQVR
jgi:hypothetical protein